MAGWGGSNITPEERARRFEEERISTLREIVALEGNFSIASSEEARVVNSLVRSGLVTLNGKNEVGKILFVATRRGLEEDER